MIDSSQTICIFGGKRQLTDSCNERADMPVGFSSRKAILGASFCANFLNCSGEISQNLLPSFPLTKVDNSTNLLQASPSRKYVFHSIA
jgi:hypothetical protein